MSEEDQTKCPKCKYSFPTDFGDCMEGDAELIVQDGKLSAMIKFRCPSCSIPLVLEDWNGSNFGINPRA